MRQDVRRCRIDRLFEEPWITLYAYRDDDPEEAWFSALLTTDKATTALTTFSWDMHPGEGRPGLTEGPLRELVSQKTSASLPSDATSSVISGRPSPPSRHC